jgi:hypothetical protein
MDVDLAYLRGRGATERAAAMLADHPAARLAHNEMAERYEELANAIEQRSRLLGLDLYDRRSNDLRRM